MIKLATKSKLPEETLSIFSQSRVNFKSKDLIREQNNFISDPFLLNHSQNFRNNSSSSVRQDLSGSSREEAMHTEEIGSQDDSKPELKER